MLTPLPWRRPWKLASQVVTLDQLSGGRAILAVGLGAVDNALGIDLMTGLFTGNLAFGGQKYTMDLSPRTDLARVAQPVQKPRPPIWVVGVWPRMKSMRRVLRCDGLLPAIDKGTGGRTETLPADLLPVREWLTQQGKSAEFDIISEGETPADDRAQAIEQIRPWAEVGCTWWLETRWTASFDQSRGADEVLKRIEAGPPRG
jgi:hypothetical protein